MFKEVVNAINPESKNGRDMLNSVLLSTEEDTNKNFENLQYNGGIEISKQ